MLVDGWTEEEDDALLTAATYSSLCRTAPGVCPITMWAVLLAHGGGKLVQQKESVCSCMFLMELMIIECVCILYLNTNQNRGFTSLR